MVRALRSSDGDQLKTLVDEIDCPFSTQDILRSVNDPRYACLVSALHDPEATIETQSLQERLAGLCFSREIAGVTELFFIGVLPDLRKKKIATALLQQLIESSVASRARCIELEVRASNIAAANLYRGLGFTLQGTRENYYPANSPTQKERESALLLTLHL